MYTVVRQPSLFDANLSIFIKMLVFCPECGLCWWMHLWKHCTLQLWGVEFRMKLAWHTWKGYSHGFGLYWFFVPVCCLRLQLQGNINSFLWIFQSFLTLFLIPSVAPWLCLLDRLTFSMVTINLFFFLLSRPGS